MANDRPARRESVWTFTISKTLAKFRVELIGVGQESVERTLLAKIIYHGIVGDAAQGERRLLLVPPLRTPAQESRSGRLAWWGGLGDREILFHVSWRRDSTIYDDA